MKQTELPTKALRTMFAVAVAGWVVALFLVLGPARGSKLQEVVRAERFELVDPKTGVRAELMLGPDGAPRFIMSDENRNPRAWLMLADGGRPLLTFFDRSHNSRASLSLGEDGTPLLRLKDADSQKMIHASLGASKGGCPWLAVVDEDGDIVWGAP
jgi:hypothetical protein